MRPGVAVIVDCGLSLLGGHHYGHITRVIDELRVAKYDLKILTSRTVQAARIYGVPVEAKLSVTGYEYDGLGFSDQYTDFGKKPKQLAADLLSMDAIFSDAQIVLFINVTPIILAGVAGWLQLRCAEPAARLLVYILNDVGVRLLKRGGAQFLVESDLSKFVLCKTSIEKLQKSSPRARFFATDSTRAHELSALGARNVSLYEIGHPALKFRESVFRQDGGYVTLYMGDAKYDKGVTQLTEICLRLLSAKSEYDIAMHVNDVGGKFADSIGALRQLSRSHARISLVEGRLTDWLYFHFLVGSSLIVLPYLNSKYSGAESGVGDEALSLAKPILCRRGSYFAERMYELGGDRYVFSGLDDLVDLISHCMTQVKEVREDFQAIRRRYLSRQRGGSTLGDFAK